MTVQEFKAALAVFPDDAVVLVKYSCPPSRCECGEYCYCSNDEREENVSYVCAREQPTKKCPNPIVKTVFIQV